MREKICNFWSISNDVFRIFWDKTVLTFGGVLSFIFYITGKKDNMIECLLVLMMVDYVTGILKAIILKKLNSKVGFCGFLKKIFVLCIIVVAYRLDIVLHLTGVDYNVRFITIAFYLANEGLSILENAALIGLPVPTQLKEILEQYKEHKLKK